VVEKNAKMRGVKGGQMWQKVRRRMPIGFYWVYIIGLMCHIGLIRLIKR